MKKMKAKVKYTDGRIVEREINISLGDLGTDAVLFNGEKLTKEHNSNDCYKDGKLHCQILKLYWE